MNDPSYENISSFIGELFEYIFMWFILEKGIAKDVWSIWSAAGMNRFKCRKIG